MCVRSTVASSVGHKSGSGHFASAITLVLAVRPAVELRGTLALVTLAMVVFEEHKFFTEGISTSFQKICKDILRVAGVISCVRTLSTMGGWVRARGRSFFVLNRP